MLTTYEVAAVIQDLVDRQTCGPGPWPLMAEPGLQPGADACSFVVRVPGNPPERYSVLVQRLETPATPRPVQITPPVQ